MNKLINILMFLIVLVVAISFTSPLFASTYVDRDYKASTNPINAKLQSIFSSLKETAGLPPNIKLVITNSDVSEAHTDGFAEVYISKLMLMTTKRDYDVLASILGHELAHIKLRHISRIDGNDNSSRRRAELEADKLGVVYANSIGYDGMAVCGYMKKLLDADLDAPPNGTHPSFKTRMQYIGCNK